MEKEEYYINKDSCSCSNSPYFLINNLFKELDTEKKKKIAKLNLGINDDNIVDIENYMEIELKLPKGIYYYHNNPTISIVANLNSKVINSEILVGENKDYLVFKYYINNDNNIYYACYLNNYFIKKWEDNNAPLEIKQIFNDNLATPTNNGLMSAEDKEKLDNLPDESIVYTKEEINTLLNDKADNSNVYSKIETDNNFATKTELNEKANSSDIYTKREANVILNTKANALEVYNRISNIEEIIGEGGSVDERIATAKSELIANASEEGDTLKKLEDRLSDVEESVGEGGSVDERIAVETNRAQAAEELLREAYESLSQSQPIPKTAEEWATMTSWEEGVIYRVAGTTSYTDYMYNGTTTIPMATYDNAIDDEPTAESDNLVKSSGVYPIKEFTDIKYYTNLDYTNRYYYYTPSTNSYEIHTNSSYYKSITIPVTQNSIVKIHSVSSGTNIRLWITLNDNNEVVRVSAGGITDDIINIKDGETTLVCQSTTGISDRQLVYCIISDADSAFNYLFSNIDRQNTIITSIATLLNTGYIYKGVAFPDTIPDDTSKSFYIATEEGVYENFGNINISAGFNILKWNGNTCLVDKIINGNLSNIYNNSLNNLLVNNKAINLSSYSVGDVVDVTPVTNTAITYLIYEVSKDDSFYISGKGGQGPRLYAFLDSEYKLLEIASSDKTLVNARIDAPSDGWLIVNFRKNNTHNIGKYGDIEKIKDSAKLSLVFDSKLHTFIDRSTGQVLYSHSQYNGYCTTKYLPVRTGIKIQGCRTDVAAICAFYNSAFEFISELDIPVSETNFEVKLTASNIPSGAVYFRSSAFTGGFIEGLDVNDCLKYTSGAIAKIKLESISAYSSDNLTKNLVIYTGNVNIGDIVQLNTVAQNNVGYIIIPCKNGDIFTITGEGGTSAKLFALVDTEYRLLSTATGTTYTNFVIKAASDGYLIINAYYNQKFTLVKDAITKLKTPFNKSRWMAMGDSIVEGYYSEYEEGTGVYHLNNRLTWASKVSAIKGYTLSNQGVGGEGWEDQGAEHGARTRVDSMDFTNFDLVTIAYGINDYKGGKILGTMNDDVATTYSVVTNMRYVIEKIIASNPYIKIIIITPLNARGYNGQELGDETTNYAIGHLNSRGYTLEDMFNAMVEVCNYYGIQYIDMTHNSIINRKNMTITLPDGVHPSINAHTMIARELAMKINCY